MKLRILDNSIRIRLDRSELRQLLNSGSVERRVVFGPDAVFAYELRLVDSDEPLRADFDGRCVRVLADRKCAAAWAFSEEVGLRSSQRTSEAELRLLVEKDFPCKHSNDKALGEKFTPDSMGVQADDDREE